MPQTVTIDGTTYAGHCIVSEGFLFVYLDGMSILDGFGIFSDPSKLAVIHESSYGHERDYEGFIKLIAINSEFGNCNVTLERVAPDA